MPLLAEKGTKQKELQDKQVEEQEEIERWSQRTALRFQTGGKHQTSSAWGLRGMEEGYDAIVAGAKKKNSLFSGLLSPPPPHTHTHKRVFENTFLETEINTHFCFSVCFVLQYVLEWRRSGEGKYSPQYTGKYLFSLSQTFRFVWMTIELDGERGKQTAFEWMSVELDSERGKETAFEWMIIDWMMREGSRQPLS